MEAIRDLIIGTLAGWGVPAQCITALISMIPLLELRGAIIAASLLDLPIVQTFIIAVLFNMVPIPFILIFIDSIFKWMKTKKHLEKIPNYLEAKALKKSDKIEKYGYFGLLLFVGIPLPGTGAWTGSLLSVLMRLDKKKSLLYIFMGVLLAGLIMTLAFYGIFDLIIGLFV